MGNIKILTGLNDKKIFKNEEFNYLIFDTNSLSIVPNLNFDKYLSNDNIIITPFIETFKLYVRFKKMFPRAKFIFVFDGGISPQITDILPKYKSKRKTSRYRIFNSSSKNVYQYNVILLTKLFEYFNEIVISDIHRNESDFIIGNLVNKFSDKNYKSLIFTHDQDFFQLLSDHTKIVYKDISPTRGTKYLYLDTMEDLCQVIDFEYLKNTKELLYYKSLCGDNSDEIPRPFGLKSTAIVKNFFKNAYIDNIDVTYDTVIKYFSGKISNPEAIKKFINTFRRNLFIINVLNEEILSTSEKIIIDTHFKNILFGNNELCINSIYSLFSEYELFFTRDELDKIIKYLRY